MSLGKFVERLRSHSNLSDDDAGRLLQMNGRSRTIGAGELIVREGSEQDVCSMLMSGTVIGHKIVGNGGRQIVSLHLPGELLDFEILFLPALDYNLQAITDCELSLFSCDSLTGLIFERPQIGKAMFRDAMIRVTIVREWMANVGRRNSRAKVAHLICEFAHRLRLNGSYIDGSFELPVTQEQISDIIGVTPMHVGRILKELEGEGLIERSKRRLNVLDEGRLCVIGDFRPTYLTG